MKGYDENDLVLLGGLAQGYAYILTHPGQPCVFYDHLYEWGSGLKEAILELVRTPLKMLEVCIFND